MGWPVLNLRQHWSQPPGQALMWARERHQPCAPALLYAAPWSESQPCPKRPGQPPAVTWHSCHRRLRQLVCAVAPQSHRRVVIIVKVIFGQLTSWSTFAGRCCSIAGTLHGAGEAAHALLLLDGSDR
jgi:hypothetical protein